MRLRVRSRGELQLDGPVRLVPGPSEGPIRTRRVALRVLFRTASQPCRSRRIQALLARKYSTLRKVGSSLIARSKELRLPKTVAESRGPGRRRHALRLSLHSD